jgi:protein-S-isoprenylcysteine O-methyltransferase Ste14
MTEPAQTFAGKGGWWVVAQGVIIVLELLLGILARGQWAWLWRAVGGLLLLLMCLLLVAGVAAHGRRLTPYPRPAQDARLLQEGIYGLIRHPLYTCNLCFLFGWALLWGSQLGLAVACLGVPFYLGKARQEERLLRQSFPEYDGYQKRVKRFIPWIW